MEYISILLLLLTLGFLWKQSQIKPDTSKIDQLLREKERLIEESARLQAKGEQVQKQLGQTTQELKQEQSQHDIQKGKSKQLFVTAKELSERNKTLQEKLDSMTQKIAKFESEELKKQKDFETKVVELTEARKKLEDEQIRVRREDEAGQAKQKAERDRIWNEHENTVGSHMKSLCDKPELSFRYYGNTELPEGFTGKLKPDNMIEFLGQYIIFDAKMSKSADLNTYVTNQVKSTTKKIKESEVASDIYMTVFLVVPSVDITSVKKHSYFEGGYSYFVITPESIEPIMASYKKISEYDLAESFDPQERENIVTLIATYDQFIQQQNARNILSTYQGIKISELKSTLEASLYSEVDQRKKNMRLEKFKPTDLKKFMQDPQKQIQAIGELVVPKQAEIEQGALEVAKETLF